MLGTEPPRRVDHYRWRDILVSRHVEPRKGAMTGALFLPIAVRIRGMMVGRSSGTRFISDSRTGREIFTLHQGPEAVGAWPARGAGLTVSIRDPSQPRFVRSE
jgi:hypothetical protein